MCGEITSFAEGEKPQTRKHFNHLLGSGWEGEEDANPTPGTSMQAFLSGNLFPGEKWD